ncbi:MULTISPECIES: peptide deformylase [unclassified Bartonella]|uniref:peptide deformylase n=1 Tax=unclassified Bartonella TaxID=2645622 RepID=UPI0015F9BA71|nr:MULTISPECIES: peptide deformylase [unclassified Bartonella]UXN02486.1 peptide deformylase [Bartonella sp. HY406]
MSIKPIIILPDPILREISKPVENINDALRQLADDMLETMYAAPGIGLAAIQIAEPIRLLVMDVADKDQPKAPMVMFNPKVIWSSDERNTYEEGCLSIPDYYAEVERPKMVRVTYIDLNGKAQEIAADDLLATCVQHEIDHLDGKLFIDHLSRIKREMVVKKFKKRAKEQGEKVL